MTNQTEKRPRKLLVVAYIFPPFFSVGGSIRVVKFLKYLPNLGWKPYVLTVDDSREYKSLRREGSEELLADLSPEVVVCRAVAGEASSSFLEKGRAAREKNKALKLVINLLRDIRDWVTHQLLIPDENITWLPFAVRQGRKIVKENDIDALFVTCPPHSAAVIGTVLKRIVRRPMVLDFRDDWVDTPWQAERPFWVRWINKLLERLAVGAADKVVLVTPVSHAAFEKRYPRQKEKMVYIPNGVDLADYTYLDNAPEPTSDGKFTIVHAGLLSVAADWNRDPKPFFQALVNIRQEHPEIGENMRMVFTGELRPEYKTYVTEMGLDQMVEEAGYLPRPEFATLLRNADMLLTINYAGFSTLIPGKIYEYWAVSGPPIMLLSEPGAAHQIIQQYKLGVALKQNDTPGIQQAIMNYYEQRANGQPVRITRDGIETFARAKLAEKLAGVLDGLKFKN
ncbi:MAG: glycosyltransferase [Chloroflexi bacterium]|nr:glycosyltransferase [Chloroflexota bacterium]